MRPRRSVAVRQPGNVCLAERPLGELSFTAQHHVEHADNRGDMLAKDKTGPIGLLVPAAMA